MKHPNAPSRKMMDGYRFVDLEPVMNSSGCLIVLEKTDD
jgi:hypothetical protein